MPQIQLFKSKYKITNEECWVTEMNLEQIQHYYPSKLLVKHIINRMNIISRKFIFHSHYQLLTNKNQAIHICFLPSLLVTKHDYLVDDIFFPLIKEETVLREESTTKLINLVNELLVLLQQFNRSGITSCRCPPR